MVANFGEKESHLSKCWSIRKLFSTTLRSLRRLRITAAVSPPSLCQQVRNNRNFGGKKSIGSLQLQRQPSHTSLYRTDSSKVNYS